MDHCLKRLEKYVVPVSWVDKADANSEDLSRLLTDTGRARVSAAVASLVDSDEVELLAYSKRLVSLINERSSEFESSLVSLRSIAEKTGDKALLAKLNQAEKRFDELKRSEAEAIKVADRERAAAIAAIRRAETAEAVAETERRRAYFLERVVNLDTATILNLHHQVTIYAVDIKHQIKNLLVDTADQNVVPRERLLRALEQMAFLNEKVLAVTRFASKANFKLDSGKIEADLASFVSDYIEQIARTSGETRIRLDVQNNHPGFVLRFNPIDVSIIVDNMISNARRAKASRIRFEISTPDKGGLQMRVSDNGHGVPAPVDRGRIFDMGYTTTAGSGLGLYHVRQVVGELGGSVELDESDRDRGASFLIWLPPTRKPK
jgi:signal transduction histidine kinase